MIERVAIRKHAQQDAQAPWELRGSMSSRKVRGRELYLGGLLAEASQEVELKELCSRGRPSLKEFVIVLKTDSH